MQANQIMPWFGLAASVLTMAMVMSIPAHAAEGDKGQDAQSIPPAFAKLDANHDGYVDLNEARKMNGLLEIFDQLDANHDGKLSTEEITQIQAKNRAKNPGG